MTRPAQVVFVRNADGYLIPHVDGRALPVALNCKHGVLGTTHGELLVRLVEGLLKKS